MAYNHKQIADAVHKALLEDPRTSLHVLSDRLGIERHTIRRALLRHAGATFRDLQRTYILQRGAAVQSDRLHRSGKETSFALGYRSAATLARLIKRARGRDLP